MTPTSLFWLAIGTGNGLLCITGLVWWRAGWRWALLFLVAGPCLMLGLAVIALILFFLIDGGVARDVPCETGCGRLTPVQLRGRRYRRPLCDQCERQRAREMAGQSVDESAPRVYRGKAEEWKI